MSRRVPLVLVIFFACSSPTGQNAKSHSGQAGTVDATGTATCAPGCRQGYLCINSNCVSCCNPACQSSEDCSCQSGGCGPSCSGNWMCQAVAGTSDSGYPDTAAAMDVVSYTERPRTPDVGPELPGTGDFVVADALAPANDASRTEPIVDSAIGVEGGLDSAPANDAPTPPPIDDNSPADPSLAECSECGAGTSSSFGTPVACYRGVVVYSNTGEVLGSCPTVWPLTAPADTLECLSHSGECGTITGLRTQYGLAFQCVEFVRRFYGEIYPTVALPCCGNANQFTPESCPTLVESFLWYPNSRSTVAPAPDDIIVFNEISDAAASDGHVAIVRQVTASSVFVISQNVRDAIAGNYQLALTQDTSGRYSLSGFNTLPTIGWLHPKSGDWHECTPSLPCPDGYLCDGSTCTEDASSPTLCTPLSQQDCASQCGTGTQSCSWTCGWGSCDGASSGQCAPGDTESCATTCGSTGTATCTSGCTWGSCVPPPEVCTCSTGFAGSTCNQCAAGYIGYPTCVQNCPPDYCNGNGSCSNNVCTCNAGFSGSTCNQCAAGYTGYPTCVQNCPPNYCNGNGPCSNNVCTCSAGFSGSTCNQCAAGYTGYPTCVQNFCAPNAVRCSSGILYTCNETGTSESPGACPSGSCQNATSCLPCGGSGQPCCTTNPCNSDLLLCVSGTCDSQPASTKMNRFVSLCDNAHWQSPAPCYPGLSATSGCSCNTLTANAGCSDQTCWQLEGNPKAFWTYNSAPSFGTFFQVFHCFEGSPGANSYSASACATAGVPAQIGYIAASPISIWSVPLYRCQLTTNAGAVEQMLVAASTTECTQAGGTILSPSPFGYVVQ